LDQSVAKGEESEESRGKLCFPCLCVPSVCTVPSYAGGKELLSLPTWFVAAGWEHSEHLMGGKLWYWKKDLG